MWIEYIQRKLFLIQKVWLCKQQVKQTNAYTLSRKTNEKGMLLVKGSMISIELKVIHRCTESCEIQEVIAAPQIVIYIIVVFLLLYKPNVRTSMRFGLMQKYYPCIIYKYIAHIHHVIFMMKLLTKQCQKKTSLRKGIKKLNWLNLETKILHFPFIYI